MGSSRSPTLEGVTEIVVKVRQGTLVGPEVLKALTMYSAVYSGLTRLALFVACLFLIYFFDRPSTLKMAAISSSETSADFLPNYTRETSHTSHEGRMYVCFCVHFKRNLLNIYRAETCAVEEQLQRNLEHATHHLPYVLTVFEMLNFDAGSTSSNHCAFDNASTCGRK